MWVFIRPRGGQKCYLLTCEARRCAKLCPIHRFDRMDQIPLTQVKDLKKNDMPRCAIALRPKISLGFAPDPKKNCWKQIWKAPALLDRFLLPSLPPGVENPTPFEE